MMMEENIRKYTDPSYSVDARQWDFVRRRRMARNVGVSCALVMAAAIAGIVLTSGSATSVVVFFLAGLVGIAAPSFGRRPSCSVCHDKMTRHSRNDEFLVCHNCKRYIWTGSRMENLS